MESSMTDVKCPGKMEVCCLCATHTAPSFNVRDNRYNPVSCLRPSKIKNSNSTPNCDVLSAPFRA